MTKTHDEICDLRFTIADCRLENGLSTAIAVFNALHDSSGFQSAFGDWQSGIVTGGPQQMSMSVRR
jgi:hypothetical protein